jgi:ketosteroid isomerase-like protein
MRPSEITADVRAFFTTYCTAFIRRDAAAIARHFADQVYVASETGKSVRVQVETGDEWRKTIDHLLGMYLAINVASAEVKEMSIHPISSRLVQASLHWALRDGKSAPLYEFDALYTLARHSETFRIIAIAHNEIPQYRRCAERIASHRASVSKPGSVD